MGTEIDACERCEHGDHENCCGEPTILEGGYENCCCNATDPEPPSAPEGSPMAYADSELLERCEGEGEAIYLHAEDCPSFCDYACNGRKGADIADAINEAEKKRERAA